MGQGRRAGWEGRRWGGWQQQPAPPAASCLPPTSRLRKAGTLPLSLPLLTAGRKPDEHSQQQQPHDPRAPSTSAAAAAAAAAARPAVAITPAAAVARRLAGVRRLTLSVPGVLLEESSPGELEESASALPGAAGVCVLCG